MSKRLEYFKLFGVAEEDSKNLTEYLNQNQRLLQELSLSQMEESQRAKQRQNIHEFSQMARKLFMLTHAEYVYKSITGDFQYHQSLSDLAFEASKLIPGLVPTKAELDKEAESIQSDKQGKEIDQGIFFWGLLKNKKVGDHIIDGMLKPTSRAIELLNEFESNGVLILDKVTIELKNNSALITFQNPECLNAEDNRLILDLEAAVDLTLLSNKVKVGVLRGGVVSHHKYAGKRVFSAGVNLKHLHQGKISFVDFLLRREFGYIHKMIRGLSYDNKIHSISNVSQKPWLSVVDSFAIGGGMQLLLASDYVVGEHGCYANLPAAKEGIIPGVANLRLTRISNGKLAKQVILLGHKICADDAGEKTLFDQVVDTNKIESAMNTAIEALQQPAVAANKHMLNLSQESLDDFREYMADFSLEQSLRLYSDDVIAKVTRF